LIIIFDWKDANKTNQNLYGLIVWVNHIQWLI
jgi:hypothetical protein